MGAYNKADMVLNIVGFGVSLSMIQEILGVIVLILTIVNILIKFALAAYQKIKDKDINGLVEDIDKTKNELENLQEKSNIKKK